MKKMVYIFLISGSFYSLNAVQAISDTNSNIREKASLTAKVVGLLKKGEITDILDAVNNKGRFWCKIPKGYVSCRLLKIDKQKIIENKKKILNTPKKVQKIKKPKTVLKNIASVDKKTKLEKFNDAKNLFLNKDYKTAYDKFYAIFLDNLQDLDVNFYLGQSAFMLKRYDEAISAYERILLIDENAVRVKLELARCYIAVGLKKQAKKIFLKVLTLDIPKNVRKNVKEYLKVMDDNEIKNSFNAIMIVGFGWDDNVESLSTNYLSEITDLAFISTNSLKSVYTHQEVFVLNHAYKYSDTVKFKNDALFFMKNHMGFSKRNIQFIQYSPSVSVKYPNRINVDYALSYNHVWLDTMALLTNYALSSKFKYIDSTSLLFGGSLKYQKNLNDNEKSKNRDASYYELILNTQMIHSKQFTSLSNIKFAGERKVRGSLTDVDYNLYDLSIALNYKYSKQSALSFKTKMLHKPYLDNYTASKDRRVDDEYQLNIGNTYAISKKYVLQGEYIYTKHDSNYNDFRFKKNQVNLNFITVF